MHFGLSYVTTRLGSALGTNAIKQDNYLLNVGYFFRNQKKLQDTISRRQYFLRIKNLETWGNNQEKSFLAKVGITSDQASDITGMYDGMVR